LHLAFSAIAYCKIEKHAKTAFFYAYLLKKHCLFVILLQKSFLFRTFAEK